MNQTSTFVKVKCIQDVFEMKELTMVNVLTGERNVTQYQGKQLFSEDNIYDVEITSGGEWRTKDDTCGNEIPYNHIILGFEEKNFVWFHKHFILLD